MRKWKLRIIAAAVVIAVAVIIISVMGADRKTIVKQYYALSNKPENSARQFKVPFGYITVNKDGTVNIEFATSLQTISNDIDVGDESSDSASGDDDRQNSEGTGTGNQSGNNTGNGSGNNSGGEPVPPPNPNLPGGYTQKDIEADINNGLYTLEDFAYLVALEHESGSYNGFYAVASSVRNRVNSSKYPNTYRGVITAANQYTGYSSSRVSNPYNAPTDVIKAAVDVLRGGASSVGTCCSFFGVYKDNKGKRYDMWADPGTTEFYNWGGNIFHSGSVHNKKEPKTQGYILIYDGASNNWVYGSGTKGP